MLGGQRKGPRTGASAVFVSGAHEIGHLAAAKKEGAKLAAPFFLPAGLGIIGSFGTITAVQSVLRNRGELLRIAAAGPLAGTAVSAALVVVGLLLSVVGAGPSVAVETGAWNDCLLMAALGQLAFGERLVTEASLPLSPLLLAGALLAAALLCLPLSPLRLPFASHRCPDRGTVQAGRASSSMA